MARRRPVRDSARLPRNRHHHRALLPAERSPRALLGPRRAAFRELRARTSTQARGNWQDHQKPPSPQRGLLRFGGVGDPGRAAEPPPKLTIQLGGPALQIAGGTITIGRSMREGTFVFRLQDATLVTGSLDLRLKGEPASVHKVCTGVCTTRAFATPPTQLTRLAKPNPLSGAAPKGPYGIRTRAAAVRGRCPRPLDEWAVAGA